MKENIKDMKNVILGSNKKHISIVFSILLVAIMILQFAMPIFAYNDIFENENDNVALVKGTYEENKVLVEFDCKYINDKNPNENDLSFLGENFGNSMKATDSYEDALKLVSDEIKILSISLGEDFVLEDTTFFSYDGNQKSMIVSLVSSEKYDTETMIKKLSQNRKIVSTEANSYLYTSDVTDYSANDKYYGYLYQISSPKANNNGGDNVDDRGTNPDDALSINASSLWGRYTGNEEEIVIAIVDTGVNPNHEDLKNRMWTNPGNIGLEGVYGYDFYNNDDDPLDDNGHGTHCAGVIAAEVNNSIGIAGITGSLNVKIMALKILGDSESTTSYHAFGAYSYIYKAIQNGVNVVAANNSWGGTIFSKSLDKMIDLVGEAGAVSVIASGNYAYNLERSRLMPSNTSSLYAISVNAADITGKMAGFSNYGKTSTNVFAPGLNILSSYGKKSYFPSIYSQSELLNTTEYYGIFNSNAIINENSVTPYTPDGLKAFGSSVFEKKRYLDDDDEYVIPDDAYLELSIEKGRNFTSGEPYRLKITIKNAQYGEDYYLYFPYEKNELTTGGDNTYISIMTEDMSGDCPGVYAIAGEILKKDEKILIVDNGKRASGNSFMYEGMVFHAQNINEGKYISSYEDSKEFDKVAIGFCITTQSGWKEGDSGDYSLYLDSIAISKPNAEIDINKSYEVESGTSMATPAVCGAVGVIAALNPRKEGVSGKDYSLFLRAKILSCVRQTETFKDLCSSGGYVDLSLIDENLPAISHATCDMDNETLTLEGINLYPDNKLTYRELGYDDSQYKDLPSDMTCEYSEDGTKVIIHNAKEFFSRYIEFSIVAKNGLRSSGKFFTVSGQRELELLYEHKDLNVYSETPYLLTNADGDKIYGYYGGSTSFSYFDGKQFYDIIGSVGYNCIKDYLIEIGYDTYFVSNTCDIRACQFDVPVSNSGKLYLVFGVFNKKMMEKTEEELNKEDYLIGTYLGIFDLNDDMPHWSFELIENNDYIDVEGRFIRYIVVGSEVYFIGSYTSTPESSTLPFYSYNLESKEWTKHEDLPYLNYNYDLVQSNGKIYVFFGFNPDHSLDKEDQILSDVYCFDGEKWEKKSSINYIGRINDNEGVLFHSDAIAIAKDGFIFAGASTDVGGNMFFYNTKTDEIEPMYYTVSSMIVDAYDQCFSCVSTKNGLYFMTLDSEENAFGFKLYHLPGHCGAFIDNSDVLLPYESHNYIKQVSEEYLKENGTCDTPSIYYLSCSVCGKISDETFEYNLDENNHIGNTHIENEILATCTNEGYTGDKVCDDCGVVIEYGKVIEKVAHTQSSVIIENEVSANCTNEGKYDEVIYCENCNLELSRETKVVPKNNSHELVYVGATFAKEKEDGNIAYYKCNLCLKMFSDENAVNEITNKNDVIIPKLGVNYIISEGNAIAYFVNNKEDLTISSNSELSKFVSLELDGQKVDDGNYVLDNETMKVSLKQSYLSSLSNQNHVLTIVSSDGKATTNLLVLQNDNKADFVGLWIMIAVVVLIAIVVVIVVYSLKKKAS